MLTDEKIEYNYYPVDLGLDWKNLYNSDGNKPADGANKREIFAQNAAPTSNYKEGDLWFDTDDNNTIYRANAALSWVSVKDGTIAGKTTTFRQAAIPTSLAAGDLWYDSDDSDKQYRAAAAGATTIAAGAWVRVDVGANPTLIDALATTNAPAEAAATVGAKAGTNLKKSDNTVLADADVITSLGTAALIASQGALATKSAVDLATAEVTNKTAGNITYTGGATVDSLKPAAVGADVTANNTAAAIAGQGALATLSTADFSTQVSGAEKPANNATVGATFGTNIAGGGAANTQITNAGYATLFRQDKFGNGADGDVTISGNTSLTADMFYNNLTINTGITLSSKGFRIFVKGTLNCVGTGKIASNGGAGGNGGNGTDANTGGAAGAAGAVDYSSGTLPVPLAGRAGGEGADEVDSVAGVGANGVDAAKSLGAAGTNGGRGGDGQAGGGQTVGAAGGTGGSKTGTILDYPKSYTTSMNLFDKNGTAISQHTISASSGGGGGGGKGPTNTSSGGGGGGSGSTGGFVWVAAKTVTNINAEAKGGAGGNGGNSSSDAGSYRGGVGAAGAGGSGGVIILIYETLTTSSLDVAGGAAGSLGTLGITTNSTAAQAGNTGTTILIVP